MISPPRRITLPETGYGLGPRRNCRAARSNPEEEVNMKRAIGTFGMLAVLFATLSLATIAETRR